MTAGATTASTTTTTTTSTATTSASSTSTSADGATPPADRVVTKLTGFTSPSGDIGCYIDRESVRCDIAERDWQPPKPTTRCRFDYGQGIFLTPGGAPEFVCASDTALQPDGDPLPYGSSISAGLLRCESAESGITCRDTESGRGFSLAREAYELF